MFNLEINPPVHHALSRLGDAHSEGANSNTSSPLKRSDAIMNLDQASLGSPVAKRRSLHGVANFGDFNVFDHAPSSPHFDIHDESNQEYELSTTSTTFTAGGSGSPTFSNMPRRSSSLRKSTLQQRHGDREKTSWGRRQAALLAAHVEQDGAECADESAESTTPRPSEKTSWGKRAAALAAQAAIAAQAGISPLPGRETATPAPTKGRPRLSLDQFIPPMARDSPFSAQGGLPNASVHVVNSTHQPPPHQPHPLSRTLTQSSSNSSLLDDSPTHVPVHFTEQPRPKLDFSKSMPAGSLRPFQLDAVAREEGFQPAGSGSFATPQNYKAVKPLPSAFMSTGLISKVNRNPEEPPVAHGGKSFMPDTPCKRPMNIFATYPQPMPGSAVAKARQIRHSFGNPSTPFNPYGTQPTQGTFGKGTNVFGSGFRSGHQRRGSFLSVDGDESSPKADADGQFNNDFDLPPTPTKQVLGATPLQPDLDNSPYSLRGLPSLASFGKKPRSCSKLHLSTTSEDGDAYDSDMNMDTCDSPTTATFRLSSHSLSLPSFSRARAERGSKQSMSPAPLASLLPASSSIPTSTPFLSPSAGFAKIGCVAPASPLERTDFIERLAPRTPQDAMLPPDPSGLSISNHKDGQAGKQSANGTSLFPPATPTAGREYFPQFGDRRLSLTPIHSFSTADVDESLSSRFEKVEMIGTGEFSLVYRVTQSHQTSTSTPTFFFGGSISPLPGRTPPTPMAERVFAVKKSRQPFQGARDRTRKLQEVKVLKALRHSDHVVHYMDSWEDKSHLYIQTEFCEEGSLDLFLAQVGRKGRLDDFRIWKIMLELSQVCCYLPTQTFHD
jgi:mitosis inhibitor protein kinase SWE1